MTEEKRERLRRNGRAGAAVRAATRPRAPVRKNKHQAAIEACSAAAEKIAEGLRVSGLEQAALGAEQVARELRGGLTMVQVAQAALIALTPNEIAELLEQMPVINAAQAMRDAWAGGAETKVVREQKLTDLFAELERAKL
jgi:urease gamma subunit